MSPVKVSCSVLVLELLPLLPDMRTVSPPSVVTFHFLVLLGLPGLRLRDDRQTLEIAVQRGGRRQCRRPIVLDSRQCGSVHRVLTGNIFGVRNLL